MKTNLFLIVIIGLTLSLSDHAQKSSNYGLVLNGTVLSTNVKELPTRIVWEAQLLMQYRNDGTKPVIIIRPEQDYHPYGVRKIDFLFKSLGNKDLPPDEDERVVFSSKIPVSKDEIKYFDEGDYFPGARFLIEQIGTPIANHRNFTAGRGLRI